MSDAAASPQETARPAQGNVFARLQALFPSSAASPPAQTRENVSLSPPVVAESPVSSVAKFFKVRIVTWNMHESLPKGDLEELLGSVPAHEGPEDPDAEPELPPLAAEADHPYHIVVIAGQECPTVSGMPMGLGAGFKLIDNHNNKEQRDREKEKEKEHHKGKEKEDALSAKRKEREDVIKRKGSEEPLPESSTHFGWTAMVEDWLCSGPHSGQQPTSSPSSSTDPTPNLHTLSNGDLRRHMAGKDQRKPKGLYQMLAKERMMGIYLAVFVHRNVRPLVKGISKSAVTAGLIGGRVGNKGGVGIAINLNGVTLLFINAHLAAHEGKIHHRLANLAKIKAELTVDDFLQPDDPRVMAEDVTDKFDYTFLCGDLNFRLDISRAHADWLISRQDYAQALAFDQLRNVMQSGQAFIGFNEAPIRFPPTFKYDVLRTIKKSKRKSSRKVWKLSTEMLDGLAEMDEKEHQEVDDDDEGGDTASVMSTGLISVQSKRTTDAEDDDDVSSRSVRHSINLAAPQSSHTGGGKLLEGLHALKTALASPSTPNFFSTGHHRRKKRPISAPVTPSLLRSKSSNSSTDMLGQALASTRLVSSPQLSLSSAKGGDDADRGVYDSSSKQRVPSWCDRILWKSTVVSDVDPEDEHSTLRPRTRVGQLIAMAFRPLRGRNMSSMSASSLEAVVTPSERGQDTSSPDVLEAAAPITRDARHSRLEKTRSLDSLNVDEKTRSSTELVSPYASPRSRRFSLAASVSDSPSQAHKPSRSLTIDAPFANRMNQSSASSIWRRLPWLSRDPNLSTASLREGDQNAEGKGRRGDVVCLSYTTLDDRGMRRLEGRSDHRPVIGSYAVYL